jgi:hypothetical protein
MDNSHLKRQIKREASAMLEKPSMTPIEKRRTAHALAQAAMFSALLDLLIRKNILSPAESTELMQEAALTFMKPSATDVEKMAGDAILSVIRNE